MVSNIKSKIFKSIKNKKLNVFGLFLLLSFLLLIVTKLSKEYTQTIPFSVEMRHIEEGRRIMSQHDSVVYVTVNARGFSLLWYNFFDHKLTIDLEKEAQDDGENYTWKTSKGAQRILYQLGNSMDVVSIEPETVVFRYEAMSVKTVPVLIESQIDFAPGFDLMAGLVSNPDSIKVIGPQKAIEGISGIGTKPIKLNGVKSSIKKSVALDMQGMGNIKLNHSSVEVSGEVRKFTEGLLEVPVDVVNLPEDVRLNFFPKTVTVLYYVDLQNFKNVTASDFVVVCDFAEVASKERTFFVPHLLKVPPKVKSARIKQSKVEFIIMEP